MFRVEGRRKLFPGLIRSTSKNRKRPSAGIFIQIHFGRFIIPEQNSLIRLHFKLGHKLRQIPFIRQQLRKIRRQKGIQRNSEFFGRTDGQGQKGRGTRFFGLQKSRNITGADPGFGFQFPDFHSVLKGQKTDILPESVFVEFYNTTHILSNTNTFLTKRQHILRKFQNTGSISLF